MLSAVPKGSGLGTSSILASTLLGAISRACGLEWDELSLYDRVLGVEQLLTSGGGWQDQAGALFPGLKLIETRPGLSQSPTVRYLPHRLLDDHVNRSLLLYYTGVTRVAKGILQEIVEDMFVGRAQTIRTLEGLRTNARRLYAEVQLHDLPGMTRCIARSWRLNKQLDGGVSTPEIDAMLAACGRDLVAAKFLGAGGGGFMVMCACDAAAGRRIRERLESEPPNDRARFVDFSVAPAGLEVTVS
jgi:galactokinase/mevalonate kinase-like predicted kinase